MSLPDKDQTYCRGIREVAGGANFEGKLGALFCAVEGGMN